MSKTLFELTPEEDRIPKMLEISARLQLALEGSNVDTASVACIDAAVNYMVSQGVVLSQSDGFELFIRVVTSMNRAATRPVDLRSRKERRAEAARKKH